MVEDIVRAFGFLTLGSRFRRIGERLQGDTQRLIAAMGVPFPPALYPFLAALDRFGPLTVGDLAEAVGQTQPGATRAVAQLGELGLVAARQEARDQRRRIVTLTKDGEKAVAFAKREVWPRIERAVSEVCADLTGPLLGQFAKIEDRLDEAPLDRRVKKAGGGGRK